MYVVSYLLSRQGPASSFDCLAILVSEYQSEGSIQGMESPIASPCGAHLPPASVSGVHRNDSIFACIVK